MTRMYLIKANCSVKLGAFKAGYGIRSELLCNYFVEGEYLMCKIVSSSKIIMPGESGQIEVSLLIEKSDYTPIKGQHFELTDGPRSVAVCECIDFALDE